METIKLNPAGGGSIGEYYKGGANGNITSYAVADIVVITTVSGKEVTSSHYSNYRDAANNAFGSAKAVTDYVAANFFVEASGDSGGIPLSEKGSAGGVATLDSNSKIPASQLPNSVMELKSEWNAATNTPALVNGAGNPGDVYECTAPGTTNFGDGNITFALGDWAVYSAAGKWHRSQNTNPEVTWGQLGNKPNTVAGFGVTDAVVQGGIFYLAEASRTTDTVGDFRTELVTGDIAIRVCTVANAVKGAGTWTTIFRTNNNGRVTANTFTANITTFTGTAIPLYHQFGVYQVAAANSATNYTTQASPTPGCWAKIRINAATEPAVTGATKVKGDAFAAAADMYLFVEYNGWRTEYKFIAIT